MSKETGDKFLTVTESLIRADERAKIVKRLETHGYLVYDLEAAEDRGAGLGDMIIPNLEWQALKSGTMPKEKR